MDENSGRNKKTRTADASPGRLSVGRGEAKPKRQGVRAMPDPAQDSEAVRVIEGGARRRAPDVKDHIGRQLKAVYDDVLGQAVPSRFMDLLQELATKSEPKER